MVGVMVIVPVEAPSGSPAGLARISSVAAVMPAPEALKFEPVVVAVNHAAFDAKVNPCGLPEAVTCTLWSGGKVLEPNWLA